jgi:hypothetical protein
MEYTGAHENDFTAHGYAMLSLQGSNAARGEGGGGGGWQMGGTNDRSSPSAAGRRLRARALQPAPPSLRVRRAHCRLGRCGHVASYGTCRPFTVCYCKMPLSLTFHLNKLGTCQPPGA